MPLLDSLVLSTSFKLFSNGKDKPLFVSRDTQMFVCRLSLLISALGPSVSSTDPRTGFALLNKG